MKCVLRLCAIAISMLGFVACGPADRDPGDPNDPDDPDDPNDPNDPNNPGEPRECNKMDIVFVVDDSGSMELEQANLATNFPMFADVLSTYQTSDGQPIDFRVAVTTTGKTLRIVTGPLSVTERGDNGKFRNTCGTTKRFLDRSDPDMRTTLACRANVGIEGPGNEQPLISSKLALSERIMDGTNAGFLRDDALLALVYLTDENDSSTTLDTWTVSFTNPRPPINWHPADQVQFLDTLKGHRSRWAAGVIAGDGDCTSAFGSAVDAGRLKDFVNLANSAGTTQAIFSSICAGDLTVGLRSALDTFQNACGGIIL